MKSEWKELHSKTLSTTCRNKSLGLAVLTLIILSFSTINLATITSSIVYMGCGASGCWRGVVAQWLEHWQLKPDVLGSIPGGATFFAALSQFKGLRTVMTLIVTCFDMLPLRSSDVAPSNRALLCLCLLSFPSQPFLRSDYPFI